MSVTHDAMLGGYQQRCFWQSLNVVDWLWALLTLAGATYVFAGYGAGMVRQWHGGR